MNSIPQSNGAIDGTVAVSANGGCNHNSSWGRQGGRNFQGMSTCLYGRSIGRSSYIMFVSQAWLTIWSRCIDIAARRQRLGLWLIDTLLVTR